MQKDIILVVSGAGDQNFGTDSNKNLRNKEVLVENLKNIVRKNNYKAIVNLTNAQDTNKSFNLFSNVRPQSVVGMTLLSEEFLNNNNELSIVGRDEDVTRLDGGQFDFIFPPTQYEVHLCGVDLNGTFKATIDQLLEKGYHVTVYSDAIRPFNSSAKHINALSSERVYNFHYCSYKSVKTFSRKA